MSPTFSIRPRAARDYAKLTQAQQRRFDKARDEFVKALRTDPSTLPPRLRVKRLQGHPGLWEMTWAGDGRAIFEYGPEQRPGEAHVIWHRIGDHSIFDRP